MPHPAKKAGSAENTNTAAKINAYNFLWGVKQKRGEAAIASLTGLKVIQSLPLLLTVNGQGCEVAQFHVSCQNPVVFLLFFFFLVVCFFSFFFVKGISSFPLGTHPSTFASPTE